MNIGMKKCQRRTPKPKWLSRTLPKGGVYRQICETVRKNELTTVCQEARCPNQFECFAKGSATFMILGAVCTRNCRFCNVEHAWPKPIDRDEPERVADAVRQMGLRYVVITSVTRDDLDDGGATIFAETIRAVRRKNPATRVEVLIPDFQGDEKNLSIVLDEKPDVLNHNVETVARLYPRVRPQAVYQRSLALLRRVKELRNDMVVKSGIMVGLGETDEELKITFGDIAATGCDILIVGQYLQPSLQHLDVVRYVSPEHFRLLGSFAREQGIKVVVADPLVRSSYRAEELLREVSESMER
jgi:lipoic acid synthetase